MARLGLVARQTGGEFAVKGCVERGGAAGTACGCGGIPHRRSKRWAPADEGFREALLPAIVVGRILRVEQSRVGWL